MEKNRVEAFSDGVFSIVITLLVLDIKLPAQHDIISDLALRQELINILPRIMTYVLSFCIVGIFWHAHHTIFNLVKAVDRTLMWLNIIYLMIVAFIPFPTSLLAEHHDKQTAVILYSFTLGLAGFFHFIILTFLYRHKELCEAIFTQQVKRQSNFPSLFGPLTYLSAILFSFFSLKISFALLIVVPVYYIFFSNITRQGKKGV